MSHVGGSGPGLATNVYDRLLGEPHCCGAERATRNSCSRPLTCSGLLARSRSRHYSGSLTGAFSPTANPYSLTIGTQISRTTAGTSTGDLNVQISAIPEPSTWALMLMGPARIGFVARRRSRR